MDPIDIVHLVQKRGWSLAQLAADNGVSRQFVAHALRHPNPRCEKIILDFLGMNGHALWPDRYAPNGKRIVHVGMRKRRGKRTSGGVAA